MEQLELQKEVIVFVKKIDNEVGKIIECLEEIFKQFFDYKNIVLKRLRFGEVIIDEDLSIEDFNDVDVEFYSSEVIEVKEIEKIIEIFVIDIL